MAQATEDVDYLISTGGGTGGETVCQVLDGMTDLMGLERAFDLLWVLPLLTCGHSSKVHAFPEVRGF